jgi:hypothetical protein
MKNVATTFPMLVKTLDRVVFRPLLESRYANKSGKGVHPNIDVNLIFKIQLLESWYNVDK